MGHESWAGYASDWFERRRPFFVAFLNHLFPPPGSKDDNKRGDGNDDADGGEYGNKGEYQPVIDSTNEEGVRHDTNVRRLCDNLLWNGVLTATQT